MKVNEKIKFLRQFKGWSQEEVANKLNMSLNGYGSIVVVIIKLEYGLN